MISLSLETASWEMPGMGLVTGTMTRDIHTMAGDSATSVVAHAAQVRLMDTST